MTCATCGTAGQPDGARFCFSCGASLAAPACVSCHAEIVAGARFCSVCGTAQPGSDVAVAAGQSSARRVTSVLFGDLVGFTTLSEARDQEDVRELLSAYFERCRQVIARYGGVVEKFIGDAVMAVWGVPTAHEDDAERAVRAGLELVGAVTAMGADLGVPDLAMRVGIVTGEVAVTIGAQHQGMVAGDAVNTAARVQSAAAPGQVWVDETTRLLTSSAITYVDAGSHHLKGKAEPVPLWSVRAVVAALGGSQRADGLEAPHVGREREMRVVKEVFHGAEETGRPAMLVVVGEPGIGKSRLAWEFEKYVDGLSTPVRWHAGRCLSYGEGVAFYAVAEAVRGRLQAPDDDGESAGTDDPADLLERALAQFVPDAVEREWLAPRLGTLLGLGVTGGFAREDLFSAWATFFQRLSGDDDEPVVLVVDDGHHADDGTLDFLEHLIAVADFPAFVVLLTRPGLLEERPTLATNRRATIVHLESLPPAQMTTLLDGLVANLPDAARRSLVQRAEGVPVFAVETVRSLVDRDLVVPRGGQYVLADPEHLDLDAVGAPASLQALIAARLDTLSPEQRAVVDRATVLGETFTRDAVAALCPDVPDVDAVLASLVRAQILQQQASRLSAEHGQHQFVQSAVRQVAYGTLARRERKALHLAVVRHLEESGADDSLAAIAAQHHIEAVRAVPDDPDVPELNRAAVAQLVRAARHASALGAPAEAAGHLRAAMEREQDEEQVVAMRLDLAGALRMSGRTDEALEQAEIVRDHDDARGDVLRAAAAVHVMAVGLNAQGDYQRVVDLVQPRYEALRGDPTATRVRYDLAGSLTAALYRRGRSSADVAQERARLAERLDDPSAKADALLSLALHFTSIGLDMVSVLLFEEASRLAQQAHNTPVLARAAINACAVAIQEDLARAVVAGGAALDAARGLGDVNYTRNSYGNLLVARLLQGSWDRIEALYADDVVGAPEQAMLELVRARVAAGRGEDWHSDVDLLAVVGEDRSMLAYAQGVQARQAATAGDAVALALQSVGTCVTVSGLYDDFSCVWHNALDVVRVRGTTADLSALRVLVEDHEDHPPTGVRAGCAWVRALEAADEGDDERAEQSFATALTLAERWRSRTVRAQVLGDRARWLRRSGRRDEAVAAAEEARAELRQIGAHGWERELDTSLDQEVLR